MGKTPLFRQQRSTAHFSIFSAGRLSKNAYPETGSALFSGSCSGKSASSRILKSYFSGAQGNHRSDSLIDLALRGGDDLTERVLYSIVRELDDLPVSYSFDVAIHSMIVNEAPLEHIRYRGGVVNERRGEIITPSTIQTKFKVTNSRCKKRLSAVRGEIKS